MRRYFIGLIFLVISGGATAAIIEQYVDAVQEVYIAYYGRPADPIGLEYWTNRLNETGGEINEIIESFANTTESTSLYNGQSNSQKITAIYNQLFNRSPDIAGLNYYTGELDAGRLSHASIMFDVLNGAVGTDAVIIDNKLTASKVFTDGLDTAGEISLYGGTTNTNKVRSWLGAVNENSNALTMNADIRDILGLNTVPTLSCSSAPYCTQVSSCAEACFHYSQCGLSRLDGDSDGIPCESYCSSPC